MAAGIAEALDRGHEGLSEAFYRLITAASQDR
jgi:hypothetical protein